MFSYKSLDEIIKAAEGTSISAVVLPDQAYLMGISSLELHERMRENLRVMQASAVEGLRRGLKSVSGLTGGDGYLVNEYAKTHKPLGGDFLTRATAIALGIQEYNAAMGRIVAAPTAGSCGILPGGILAMMEQRGTTEDAAVNALTTAGAVGMVIANRATISGAAGGCQAECGAAAAMTAAALVELSGGNAKKAAHAVAIALMNVLGLVCDPVAGLVEVPCILRNGGGMALAVNAADLAMAGVNSIIPADEVISTMGEIGRAMPESLRETSRGGLATTPTGAAIARRLFSQ
jgi:L-serine dehydratase